MTIRLIHRLARLEAGALAPWMRTMATAIAGQEGLDPRAVLQESQVILRQIHEAGMPFTLEAVTAFLAQSNQDDAAR